MTITVSSVGKRFGSRNAVNVIRVASDASGLAYIDLTNLFKAGFTNLGIQLQAVGAAAIPSFTLADPEYASIPANDAKVSWDVRAALTLNAIATFPIGATVLRLNFPGAGSVNVCVL